MPTSGCAGRGTCATGAGRCSGTCVGRCASWPWPTAGWPGRPPGTGGCSTWSRSCRGRRLTGCSPTSTSGAPAPTASPPAARSTWARRRAPATMRRSPSGWRATSRRSRIPRLASRSSRCCESVTSTTARISTARPELVLIPRDERVHVESSRRDWPDVFMLHDTLDPEHFYGYSGHHGVTGIIAAAGPGIRPGTVPEGSEITQLAATVLRLHGLSSDGPGAADRGDPGPCRGGGHRGGRVVGRRRRRLLGRRGGRHPRAAPRPRLRVGRTPWGQAPYGAWPRLLRRAHRSYDLVDGGHRVA